MATRSKVVTRQEKLKNDFQKKKSLNDKTDFSVATENMDMDSKLRLLKRYGREDLADLFKEEWQPRRSPARKKSAPLDQRVTITVTDDEKESLMNEVEKIKSIGSKTSMAEIIRSRTVGAVDIQQWKNIAEKALKDLDDIESNKTAREARRGALTEMMDDEDDEDQAFFYQGEINKINEDLAKLVAQSVKRSNRLSGRMSTAESETIKYRAQRLCISASDFLRMMVFALEPDSHADAHMSLDAKRRFYISIIDVAENGWGTPSTVYHCSQCENYVETIRNLTEELRLVKNFGDL